jgi:hypothetical protein
MALNYDELIAKYNPVLGLEVHVELNTELVQNQILRPVPSVSHFLERFLL